MRSQANSGLLWSEIKWGALDLALAYWGFYLAVLNGGSEAGARWFGAAMILAAVAGMAFLVKRARRLRSPAVHPLDRELAAYGNIVAVSNRINLDFKGHPFIARHVQVGTEWLCYAGKNQVTVRLIETLVWAYVERITHRLNMIIPYRPASYQLLLWDRYGRAAAIPISKRRSGKVLEAINKAAPWLFLGYSEALKESWNADRPDLISLVDARREDVRSHGQQVQH